MVCIRGVMRFIAFATAVLAVHAAQYSSRRLLDEAPQATVDIRVNSNTNFRNNAVEPAVVGAIPGQVQVRTTAKIEAAQGGTAELQQAGNAPVTFGDGDFPFVGQAETGQHAPVTSLTGEASNASPVGESFDQFLEKTWGGESGGD